jgi:type IV secretion system protein VirB6
MDDPMVFQFVGETVTNATEAFIAPAAERLMSGLQLLILTGVTLYITLTGYAVATGAVQSPFWTFAKQCMKIVLIAFFALSVDGYVNNVMSGISGLEVGLANAMTGAPAGPTSSIYQTLDHSLAGGFEIVQKCFEKADEAGFSIGAALGWVIAGLVVATGTILIALLGGGVIIVAKFSLAVVLAFGPLFIASLMFPATAKFFDSWFSQVMNYVLTLAIMAAVMSFAIAAFNAFVSGADFSGSNDDNPMFAALQIGAVSGVLCFLIAHVGSMASGLAGGVSAAALGLRHLASPVTGALGATTGVANMVNARSTRRDMQSGQMVTAGRTNHLVAGNTMFNPAYRQHVMQHLGKNWGSASGGTAKQ